MSLHLPGGTRLVQTFINGGLIPRGAWDETETYIVGDSVSYEGTSYVLYELCVAGTLPTNTLYWQLLAASGATGADGEQGPAGPAGESGEGIVNGWIYFPNYEARDTDGSYRIGMSGNNLVMQRRESGVWEEKGAVTP